MFNNEYFYWREFFSQKENLKKITYLKKIYKDKRIILYSNGSFFDALVDSYRLKKILNIIGISDIRYEKHPQDIYKGYRCIKPSEINKTKCDLILITAPNPNLVKKYLKTTLGIKTKIEAFAIKDFNAWENSLLKFQSLVDYFINSKNILKTVKYSLFCTNNEIKTKTNYIKLIEKISQKEKIRVQFICEESAKWCYTSLYKELKKNEKFEVLPVVIYPIITKNRIEFNQGENIRFFKKINIEAIDGYDYKNSQNLDLKTFEPDIVFYQNAKYIQGNNHPLKTSEYALTIMNIEETCLFKQKNINNKILKTFYSSLWKLFINYKENKKFYETQLNLKNKDVINLMENPKFDNYLTTPESNTEENTNYKIIWAPHSSINNEGDCLSTFKNNYTYFLNLAKKHSNFHFIFKPDPELKNLCINTGFLNKTEFENYINEWKNLKNAKIELKGDYISNFKFSDLLITDSPSLITEYYPTLHPIIFLKRDNNLKLNKLGKILIKGVYVVKNNRDLEILIKKILIDKKDILLKTRKDTLNKIYKQQTNPISKRIEQLLKKELFLNY